MRPKARNKRNAAFRIIKVQFYAIQKIFGGLSIVINRIECKKAKMDLIARIVLKWAIESRKKQEETVECQRMECRMKAVRDIGEKIRKVI